MSLETADDRAPGLSRRAVEIVISALMVGLAGLVLWDSYGRGAGWDGGPQSGFFPARIAWIFLAVSGFILFQAFRRKDHEVFVTWAQLKHVLRVFLPLAGYVALIEVIGLYVASFLFVIVFMAIVGGTRWWSVTLTAVIVPVIAFWVFEVQFQVPLPKGPVEALLGY
jgi:putative tricarboxylic transport membrane protein